MTKQRQRRYFTERCNPPIKCPKCREQTTIIVIDKFKEIKLCFSCATKEGWLQ